MTHRIYYNFQWNSSRGVNYPDAFWDAIEELGEIRTNAEGFNMLIPGDAFENARKVFDTSKILFKIEQASTSTSAWPSKHDFNPGNDTIAPTIAPAFLECALCHDVLSGNAAQIGVHLSEHLRDILDVNALTRPS